MFQVVNTNLNEIGTFAALILQQIADVAPYCFPHRVKSIKQIVSEAQSLKGSAMQEEDVS